MKPFAERRVCFKCNERFIAARPDWRYCSKACYYASMKVSLEEIYNRDEGICHICGRWVPFKKASRDHVVPRCEGGKTTFDNIKLAHKMCNSNRGHKKLEEFIPVWNKVLPIKLNEHLKTQVSK